MSKLLKRISAKGFDFDHFKYNGNLYLGTLKSAVTLFESETGSSSEADFVKWLNENFRCRVELAFYTYGLPAENQADPDLNLAEDWPFAASKSDVAERLAALEIPVTANTITLASKMLSDAHAKLRNNFKN